MPDHDVSLEPPSCSLRIQQKLRLLCIENWSVSEKWFVILKQVNNFAEKADFET